MSETLGYGVPAFYDHINVVNSAYAPSEIHVADTKLAAFFRRYLLQKAIARFKWTLPANWERNYFFYCLYMWGFIAVIDTNKYGVIPQGCSIKGYNVMYQPTHAVIANPLLSGIREPRIGDQCALIKLQPDFGGVMDLVNFYGSMMALCAESAATNLINSKLAYVFTAQDKAAAESFKKLFDNIAAGQPAVVVDKELFDMDGRPAWQAFQQNLKQNFISQDILDELRTWEYAFDQKIGYKTANTEKRERLITAEVNAQQEEVASLAELWMETLQDGIQVARKLFGYTEDELNVEWRRPEAAQEVQDDRQE